MSKGVNGTDTEYMDTRVPKVTGKVKRVHLGMTYVGKS